MGSNPRFSTGDQEAAGSNPVAPANYLVLRIYKLFLENHQIDYRRLERNGICSSTNCVKHLHEITIKEDLS